MPEPAPKKELDRATKFSTAFDVVGAILLAKRGIESMHFVTYHEGPNWRDRGPTENDNELTIHLRGLQQDRAERIHRMLSRDEISPQKLEALARGLAPGELVGVASDVRLAGARIGQIPMMDFMCPTSAHNQATLTGLLKELPHSRGYLLESGRSYHYYGAQILGEREWHVFLGKCLLMSGFVDDRYIGHQLVDGHCVLRLSAGKLKTGVPKVLLEL